MRTIIATALILTVGLGTSHPLWACTIFKVTRLGVTLVGNNEDDNNADTKVWFLVPEQGKYGRVFFGYNDAIPQGGMNDRGLFFDWVADNPSDDWTRDPRKLNFAGSVSEKMLEEAASVDEALQFYEIYNETAFLKSRTMLVDRTGASAIVSWHNGRLHIERGWDNILAMGYAAGTAEQRLGQTKILSVEAIASVLEACVQDGEYPTQYSNLYDLQNGDVYVYLFHRKQPFVKLNLKTELCRGNHYYNIPQVARQMHERPMTDHKTQPVAEVDPAIYSAYVGQYRIEPDYIFTISTRDGKLYYEAHDASRIELYPASSTRFFLRSLEGYLTFEDEKEGRTGHAILHVRGKDKYAGRVN